jgi:hypothetical protein
MFQARSRFTASDLDMAERIFVRQLRDTLPELMPDFTSGAQVEFKALIRKQLHEMLPKAIEKGFQEARRAYVYGSNVSSTTQLSPDLIDERCPIGSSADESLRRLSPSESTGTEPKNKKGLNIVRGMLIEQNVQRQRSRYRRQVYNVQQKHWIYKWRFGTLTLTIRTASKERQLADRAKEFQVNLTFSLAKILRRGIDITYTQITDSRGYPIISPEISTFAVVPLKSEQIICILEGKVDDLRELFKKKRLAAPTDRDENGIGMLSVSAIY